jgi:hypothetical protein
MNACKVLELASGGNLAALIFLSKQEIAENSIKEKSGNTDLKRFKAIQKYLNSCAKSLNNQYSTTWISGEYQCFLNGYTGFLLKNHFEELPTKEIEKPINLEELAQINANYSETEIDIADIKAKLKIFKAENKGNKTAKTCDYDIGAHRYNAQYLLDCYTILDGENIKFYQPSTKYGASIFESSNGKALVLPIRKKEEND